MKAKEITGVRVYFYNGMYILTYIDDGFHLLENKGYYGIHGTEVDRLEYAIERINDMKDVKNIQEKIDEYKNRIKTKEKEIKKTQEMIAYQEKLLQEELKKQNK